MKKIISVCICFVIITFPVTSVFTETKDIDKTIREEWVVPDKYIKDKDCRKLQRKIIGYSDKLKRPEKRNGIICGLLFLGYGVTNYNSYEESPFWSVCFNVGGLYFLIHAIFFYDRKKVEKKLNDTLKEAVERGYFEMKVK